MTTKIMILVPTDFSVASRAAVRFAVQWAQYQRQVQLVFVHVMPLMRLTQWTDEQYAAFAKAERTIYQKRLSAFVAEMGRRLPLPLHSFQLLEGSADLALMDFCRDHPEIAMICMGTKGAGATRRLLGTNTGNLILHSETPVIAVPAGYRRGSFSRIVYATDLTDASAELKKVVAIARPLHASLTVLHLKEPGEMTLDTGSLQKLWEKQSGYDLNVEFRKANETLSIAANISDAARKLHPSLLVLFSNRRRTLFQRLFYPSSSERLAFEAKTPLLVMGKNHD